MGKQCCNPLNKAKHPSIKHTIGIRPITSEVFEQCKQHLPEYQWKENMTVCTGCRSSIASKIKTILSSKIEESISDRNQVQKFEVENMDSEPEPSPCSILRENDELISTSDTLKTKENIAEAENVRHKCLICAVEFMQRKPRLLQDNNASARRASPQTRKVLDEHSIFFAMNNCLRISLQQCEDLFYNLIENFGEPGHWGVSFCSQHAGIIEELNQIHNTVLQLETKREKLMKKLKRDVTVSLKSNQDVELNSLSKGFKGIRDSLRNVFLPGKADAVIPASAKSTKPKLMKVTKNLHDPINTIFMDEIDEEPDIKMEIEDPINEDVTLESFDWSDALSIYDDNNTEDENDNVDNFEPDIVPDNPNIPSTDCPIVPQSVPLTKAVKDKFDDDYYNNRDSDLDSSNEYQCLKTRKNTKRNLRTTKTSKIKTLPAVKPRVKLVKKSVIPKSSYRFGCRVCSQRFLSVEMRDAHQIEQHGPGKHFSCETCGEQFSCHSSVIYHMGRRHSDKKPFPCDECPKAYSFQADLNKHKKTSHGEKMKCSHCGKEFQGKHRLNRHITLSCLKTHIRRRPAKKTCEICGKVYCNNQEFKRHQAKEHLATYERVICDECGKTLSDPRSLRKHKQAIHLKNYKHQCSICNYKCLFKSLLESHMQSAHGDGVKSSTKSANKMKN